MRTKSKTEQALTAAAEAKTARRKAAKKDGRSFLERESAGMLYDKLTREKRASGKRKLADAIRANAEPKALAGRKRSNEFLRKALKGG